MFQRKWSLVFQNNSIKSVPMSIIFGKQHQY